MGSLCGESLDAGCLTVVDDALVHVWGILRLVWEERCPRFYYPLRLMIPWKLIVEGWETVGGAAPRFCAAPLQSPAAYPPASLPNLPVSADSGPGPPALLDLEGSLCIHMPSLLWYSNSGKITDNEECKGSAATGQAPNGCASNLQ